ncbi:MAG: hypothetical protein PUB96_08800 [Helicobacteraceae bacterium]|nr:hypothetical protein [Helicobacteraceae bacterium]
MTLKEYKKLLEAELKAVRKMEASDKRQLLKLPSQWLLEKSGVDCFLNLKGDFIPLMHLAKNAKDNWILEY